MQRSRSKPTVITRMNDKSLDLKKQLAAVKSKDQSFTDWTYIGDTGAPAFQNSWVNSDPTEVTYSKIGFIKNSSGWVYLCGELTAGAANTLAFTLPQGSRPRKRMMFPISNQGGTATGYVQIDSTGAVTMITSGVSANWNLSSISFRAES